MIVIYSLKIDVDKLIMKGENKPKKVRRLGKCGKLKD